MQHPAEARQALDGVAEAGGGRGGAFECAARSGDCGVVPATWPVGTERGLPDWYVAHTRKLALAARAARASA